jgi:AraC-like DNA-binding protein
LKWLQWTITLFCLTLILDIVDQFIWSMDLIFGISSIHLTLLFLINWMYNKGLRQPQIFLGITENDQQLSLNKEDFILNRVPNSTEKKDIEKIKQFMIDSNIYTKPDLNLNELALCLELSPRQLSYLINNFLNQNFVTFVNHYRIEKAKHRLKNPKEKGETILEIMYEVGFNSKSSFNTLFKESTGYTPSEFKNLP